jgi:hypothetical protein
MSLPEPADPAMLDPDPEPAIAEPDPMSLPEPAIDEPAIDDPEPEPAPVSAFFFLQPAGAIASDKAKRLIAIRMGYPPGAMLRRFRIGFTFAAAVLLAAPAAADPDLVMPPGTRKDADGQLVSGRGLRDSTDFLAKELSRKGIAVQQIGPSRVRGVELTRFISQTASTPWLAIHVLRAQGKTLIFFVARSSP